MGCKGCALAYMGQGHQPQGPHVPRVSKGEESHKWKAPLGALGGRETSPWPPHLGDWIS